MIHPTAVIGDPPEHRSHIGSGIRPSIHETARVEAFVSVDAGIHQPTHVGADTWLMKHSHVGHDAYIGQRCELAPGTVIGGHAQVGDDVRFGVNASVKPYVKIGDGARVGMGAVVICDIPPGEVWAGNPARMIHTAAAPQMTPSEVEGWEEWFRGSRA